MQFLIRHGMECTDVESVVCVKDRILTSECECSSAFCSIMYIIVPESCSIISLFLLVSGVDKIVGYALSHLLKHRIADTSVKDARVVLSAERHCL
jgi:hypothetical protein